ncbi:hypothetical protein [Embleya sp. NPDC059237]|uniref:hypothetical protein n=1 Tax=Embleya sp. NPDC059237 TaxID=3346784 RepID=UPI00368DCE60
MTYMSPGRSFRLPSHATAEVFSPTVGAPQSAHAITRVEFSLSVAAVAEGPRPGTLVDLVTTGARASDPPEADLVFALGQLGPEEAAQSSIVSARLSPGGAVRVAWAGACHAYALGNDGEPRDHATVDATTKAPLQLAGPPEVHARTLRLTTGTRLLLCNGNAVHAATAELLANVLTCDSPVDATARLVHNSQTWVRTAATAVIVELP